jgi:hypothetical protein
VVPRQCKHRSSHVCSQYFDGTNTSRVGQTLPAALVVRVQTTSSGRTNRSHFEKNAEPHFCASSQMPSQRWSPQTADVIMCCLAKATAHLGAVTGLGYLLRNFITCPVHQILHLLVPKITHYIAWMVEQMNDELQRIWKEAVVAKLRYTWALAWRKWRQPWEPSVRIAGVPAEIRYQHPPPSSYNIQFGKILLGCKNKWVRDGHNMQYA